MKLEVEIDVTGFEQGGINSGDFYKLYNNEQLIRAQASCLGVNIKSSVISAVGQADDVILCSNNIENLKLLAKLTEIYCAEYRVKLVPSKTKLLGLSKPKHEFLVQYAKLTNRVTIEDVGVSFVEDAEHVGIIRSTHGNMPNILNRISCYKKALGAIGSSGMARSHRGNPAATIRVHKLYAEPILFTGLASLVLLSSEIKMISSHHKKTLQFLQRLHENTPRAVVYFLGGSLPAEALLHMRQLSLFIMICLCPNDPLFRHGTYILNNCRPSSKSWFFQILALCEKYGLPHPIELMENPPTKMTFKKTVKLQVLAYWNEILRTECSQLQSLKYFKPEYYSLTRAHYIWTTTSGFPFETAKASVLARMISGRFRSEMFCRRFSNNSHGYCLSPYCHNVAGTMEHILVTCPSLNVLREYLYTMCLERTVMFPALHQTVKDVLNSSEETKVQFFLEPLSFHDVREAALSCGPQFVQTTCYITRTFVFWMNREYRKSTQTTI